MSVTLYDRTEALAIVRDLLDESEGELTPEIESLLNDAEGDFATKAERVALFIREQEATATAIEAERDRLNARAKALSNSADRLKRYLQANLDAAGKDKVKGVLVTIAIQNNAPAVQIIDGLDLPDAYVRVVPERREPDKKALLAAHKDGVALPEGVTVTVGRSLRIR